MQYTQGCDVLQVDKSEDKGRLLRGCAYRRRLRRFKVVRYGLRGRNKQYERLRNIEKSCYEQRLDLRIRPDLDAS